MSSPRWLRWAQRLQAIGQIGLTYAKDPFDVQRYTEVERISAEMMAEVGGLPDADGALALFAGESGYATPKVDVRAAVFHEGRLLLVREREDGCWTLPGGWADVGDAPSVVAVREAKEESGYDIVARKVAAVYDRDLHGHPAIPFYCYKILFLCDLMGGEASHSVETDGVGFFAEDQIPPLSVTRVTAKQIGHLFDHLRHPEWPTSFD